MCNFFYQNREIESETCFAGIKYYLFASELIRNFYTQDQEIVSKNAG